MAKRKQFLGGLKADPELAALMETKRQTPVTDAELREQRISFAYGNALNSDGVTKQSVRDSSCRVKLRA